MQAEKGQGTKRVFPWISQIIASEQRFCRPSSLREKQRRAAKHKNLSDRRADEQAPSGVTWARIFLFTSLSSSDKASQCQRQIPKATLHKGLSLPKSANVPIPAHSLMTCPTHLPERSIAGSVGWEDRRATLPFLPLATLRPRFAPSVHGDPRLQSLSGPARPPPPPPPPKT